MKWLKLLCGSLIKITRVFSVSFHKCEINTPIKKRMPNSAKFYLYEISEPSKHFEYIVVKNNLSQKVRDKMEYPEVVRQLGKKINISYYLKTVVSLCA